ncbi:helix-turn-helix domain-containing protein [Lacipirellula limnantheis]|uniref:MarR family protein n=1 Tax=Lacipirellula limnantheis TaxID=2528024 RepID=A0A517TV24_9BACT|nr:helix-turn-helix domain-containing protein [Lacipirellula limnantheis]QDT72222.1 hypothetical protein I41_13930 [Lacipirellula limnantheis]
MDSAVNNAEVAKYKAMLKGGGTIPAVEAGERIPPVPAKRKKNAKAAGRFQTMNDFADLSARLVDTTAQAVWWILFRETKPNGLASVSFNQIADLIGLKRRAAMRAVQDLEEAGLLTVVKRGSLNAGPSTYRIHGTPKTTVA